MWRLILRIRTRMSSPWPEKEGGPPASERGRDAAKQETREALLRAGDRAVLEQGLDAPSLDAHLRAGGLHPRRVLRPLRGPGGVHRRGDGARDGELPRRASSRSAAPSLDLYGIVGAFTAAVAGGAFTPFGAVPLHQFLAACARSPALRRRYVAILERTRERLAEAVRAGQGAGSVRRDVDARLWPASWSRRRSAPACCIELRVPFDAGDHADAVNRMLAPR